ncbi:MAG: hypothetical protein ABI691_19535 [Ginsengibacter sp.]
MKKMLFSLAANFLYAGILVNLFSCNTTRGFTGIRLKTGERMVSGYRSATSLNTTQMFRNEIPARAVRSFIHEFRFNDATDVAWRRANDGGYVVAFMKDSIKTMIFYGDNGSHLYSLRTYGENKMPANMTRMIKDAFPDHAIAKVDEVIQPWLQGEITYYVLIKNATNFKMLRICNMEMEITGSYNTP